MSTLAVCATFRNEAPFLLEWIAYHRVIGFDHFYLYDDGSTDGGAERVDRSAMGHWATLTRCPPQPAPWPAWQHFLDAYRSRCDWVAFIGIDDFIVPLTHSTIRPLVGELGLFSAILLHRRVFGSSVRRDGTPGLILGNRRMRTPDDAPFNRHVRSLVKTADLLTVTDQPDVFSLTGPVCDAGGHEVPNVAVQPSACHTGAVVNHYPARFPDGRRHGTVRPRATLKPSGSALSVDQIRQYDSRAVLEDGSVDRFLPDVRILLGLDDASPGAGASQAVEQAGFARDQWLPQGVLAFHHVSGAAMVFCDHTRKFCPWLVALRGPAAGPVDPTFLTDAEGRLRDFPTQEAALAGAEAALRESGAGFLTGPVR